MRVAGVCKRHGFYQGQRCPMCVVSKSNTAPQVMLFTPCTYEDLGVEPVHITSKRQLVEECKRRDLRAARLQ